ncbi:MAG: 6-carboxytetrahydropterin synthase [Rhodocyclaceae bacterium]
MLITRRLEFDAGHRIPDHRSLCRHMHGHRYVLEATVAGDVTLRDGDPRNGMVVNFSEVKSVLKDYVVGVWDHAFLVYEGDTVVREMLKALPDHRTVVLSVVPTAENLAAEAFRILAPRIAELCDKRLTLENIRLYETPNCWADATRAQFEAPRCDSTDD